ncbi:MULTISPECIES: rhodanese-like domain-containing protein [unclassified Aurantimonas]|uniref:rhodanese-like domain-containing protein n=2 Tax=unclassified Aurantimonas TaxID=2638230 RepID=UPI002E19436C|nr:rhodanese-like domain-containing protein [Aurantimonas sp. A3-2-R12]
MAMGIKDFIAAAMATAGSVSPRDAHGADAVILDVREAGELAQTGRVAGSVHVPRGFLEARADPSAETADAGLTAALDKNQPVYVLCASGARAAMAAKTLTDMGYTAKSIEGGLKGWRECGLPVETR